MNSDPQNDRPDGLYPLDDALCDEIAAEMAAEHAAGASGTHPPTPLELRDDGPDPLGIGWKWAMPDRETVAAAEGERIAGDAHDQLPTTTRPIEANTRAAPRMRYGTYAAVGALAASLLVGLGVLLGIGRNEPRTTPFDVSAERLQLLGSEKPAPAFVSPMRGYVAAIGVSPSGKVVVWPSEDGRAGRPVPVAQGEQVRVGPFPGDTETVLVVVTEQPATDDLLREFGADPLPPGDRNRLRERVTTSLRALSYRHLATGQAEYQTRP